jgi:hypothetical protein
VKNKKSLVLKMVSQEICARKAKDRMNRLIPGRPEVILLSSIAAEQFLKS